VLVEDPECIVDIAVFGLQDLLGATQDILLVLVQNMLCEFRIYFVHEGGIDKTGIHLLHELECLGGSADVGFFRICLGDILKKCDELVTKCAEFSHRCHTNRAVRLDPLCVFGPADAILLEP